MANFIWDAARQARTGLAEAVFCHKKSLPDLIDIIQFNIDQHTPILLTLLEPAVFDTLPPTQQALLDYDSDSRTAILFSEKCAAKRSEIGIVTAGTSDMRIAKEVQRTLYFNGFDAPVYSDVGVAGLWRLLDKLEDIQQHKIIIAIAGMEGALFSVLSGLISAPLIAVPSSVGYGVSADGKVALDSALASCSPGITAVNIDNGFGAANAAIKIVNQFT